MQPLQRGNIRLAATVMLLRDTAAGMQVYMVQRPGRGDFPDLYVFPGGKVDELDWAPSLCAGLEDTAASAQLGIERGGLRYWMAVARECYEECGVLLVHHQGTLVDFASPGAAAKYATLREQLLAGEIDFAELCRLQKLTIACDRLTYFSHWLTPESAPRRFDTRFYLAAMPPDQTTLAHTDETADDLWIRPADALANYAAGTWQMIDPTLRSLETLSQWQTVAAAQEGAQRGDHLMPLTAALRRQGMQPLR